MKAIAIVLTSLASLLIVSCKNHEASNNFPGTYVMQVQGEYAKDFDTIIIIDNNSGKTYSIQNRTGYQKIRNGVVMPLEHKQDNWSATWDEDKEILSEADLGRQIQFKNDGKTLILKNAVYQKIK